MNLFLAHAGLMAVGFLLFLSALLVAATQRRKRWWLRAHRTAGSTAAAVVLMGAATAAFAIATFAEDHFKTVHSGVGLLTIFLAVFTPTLGLFQSHFPARAGTLRLLHRLSGRLLNLAAPITILLGLRTAGLI